MNDKIRIRSVKEVLEDSKKTKVIKIGKDPNLEKLNKLAEEKIKHKNTIIIPWSVIILFLAFLILLIII